MAIDRTKGEWACNEDFSDLNMPSHQGAADPEVFRAGTLVFVTHTISAAMTEEWIRRIRESGAGFKIDWHYSGGRARVLVLGDMAAARQAIYSQRPVHDRMMYQTLTSGNHPMDENRALHFCDAYWESFLAQG